MTALTKFLARVAVCVVAAGALASCGSSTPKRGHVVTVTVPPTTSAARASGTTSGSGTSTPSPTGTAAQQHLGGTCDSLLPDVLVTQALHVNQIAGQDAFVVGLPDKTIGRLSTINCRYGVTGAGTSTKPKVEIGVSLYTTPTQAAARIKATADDYATHGATSKDTTVDGQAAVVLSGGVGAGYDVPLFALSVGQRTIAVSVDAAVSKDPNAAGSVASLAIKRTTG
ncbi:MAG: hypothetical protein ACR2LX_03080 [Jatrophihabitans sp.]